MGLVSPLGCGVDFAWERLIAGETGIKRISGFDAAALPSKIAGVVPDGCQNHEFDPTRLLPAKDIKRYDRFIMLALQAAQEAVEHAALDTLSDEAKNRTGVLVASGIGGQPRLSNNTRVLDQRGPRRISPFFIPGSIINTAAGAISIEHGLKGPNIGIATACASGTHAIGEAMHWIRSDRADIVLCGSTEACVDPLVLGGFSALRALSTKFNDEPERASRPWDRDRDGFVLAEGAAVLVLEELEHAKRRGAMILGEVAGYGATADAHHITAPSPDGQGAIAAMKIAIDDAGLGSNDIDYVNAHAASTPLGDKIELKAIGEVLQGRRTPVLVSSTKSSVGHGLGAAGSIEAVFCLKAIADSICPPTLNLENPPSQPGVTLIGPVAQAAQVNVALSNSFAFGGANGALVFKALVSTPESHRGVTLSS